MMDMSEFSFSFKCDWCNFSTKNILEIKDHVDTHRKEAEQNTDSSTVQATNNTSGPMPPTAAQGQIQTTDTQLVEQNRDFHDMKARDNDNILKDGTDDDVEEEDRDSKDESESESETDHSDDEGSEGQGSSDDDDGDEEEGGEDETENKDGKSYGDKSNDETGEKAANGGQTAQSAPSNSASPKGIGSPDNQMKKTRRKPPIPKKAIKGIEEMTNEEWEQEDPGLDNDKDCGAIDDLSQDEDYQPRENVRTVSTRGERVVTRSRDEQIQIHQFTEGQSSDSVANNALNVGGKQQQAKFVKRQKYECNHCNFSCKYKYRLNQHMKVHGKVPVVKKSVPKKDNHIKRGRPYRIVVPSDRYKCRECDFSCKFKYGLKEHKNEYHRPDKTPPGEKQNKTYVCEICQHVALNKSKLLRHVRKHTGEKPFTCEECGMRFSEKGNLEKHKGRHTTETNYLCEECGKAFRRDINLRMHRRIHKTENLYTCEDCDYKCVRKDMLESHRARKHIKMKTLLCDNCGKGFYSKQELESHRRNKHSQRVTPHKCPLCPGSFITEYKLKAHLKTHPEYKPFKCDYCGVLFRKSASLIYHRRVHTGEKPLQCELCNYVTSTPSNMYKHRKREHGISHNPNGPSKRGRRRGRSVVQAALADMKLVMQELPTRVFMSQPVTTASTVTALPSAETEEIFHYHNYTQPTMQLTHTVDPTHPHQQSPPQLQPQPQPHPHTHQHQQVPTPVSHPQQLQVGTEQLTITHTQQPQAHDVISTYSVPPVHQVHQLLFHQ